MTRQNISAATTKVQSTKNPKASTGREKRHPLDWLVFLFLVLTFVATAAAACYTRKQWITADDTEKRQVRAYAFATPTGVKDFEIGKAPTGGVGVRTMGQTPAYKIRGRINVGGLPYPLPADADLSLEKKTNQVQNSAFISPTNVFSLDALAAGQLNDTTKKAIDQGTEFRLYVWGRVDYEDVFALSHWFTFCYSYDGKSILGNQTVETCPRYNEADAQ
jgi:hypothetical protein